MKKARQRQILYGITYMWNLKKKRTHISREYNGGFKESREGAHMELLIKGYKLSVIRGVNSENLMFNVVDIANNTVIIIIPEIS